MLIPFVPLPELVRDKFREGRAWIHACAGIRDADCNQHHEEGSLEHLLQAQVGAGAPTYP